MMLPSATSRVRPGGPAVGAGEPSRGVDDPRVLAALEEWLEAVEAGQQPDRSALLARHPEIADDLVRCLDGLEFVQAAVPLLQPAALPPGEAQVTDVAGPRTALGDYRILREVGRGGMGIVYEAEQLSLGRRVALKVLPFAAALDARQLQRFKTEAQAAAQLHHPHIVPVHAVGCERGVHYYAMQFIDGRTLADLIHELRDLANGEPSPARDAPPTRVREPAPSTHPIAAFTTARSAQTPAYFQGVANLGIQAAEALDYAHQVGVVHRDIKPANLLVDGRGHLWITDFGLARFQGDAGPTLTGDLVGTLRYMSPEQAYGKRGLVDQRTDIYALGVTLYELLTLKPAFDGETREELLWQTAHEEPMPPRWVNRAVPVELETIVLKAMAKVPDERYATAQELAEDLRRFLSDKPILARRPTLRDRATKWVRRHRRLVAGCTAIVFLAAAGFGTASALLWREQQRTAARFQLARQTVNDMYVRVAEEWLDRQPYLEQVQVEFLRKALAFYQEFAQEMAGDPHLRLEAATAWRRVGDIQRKLGAHDAARAAYDQAVPLLEALTADTAATEAHEQLAVAHNNRGHLYRDQAQLREAEADYRQALDLYRDLVDASPQRSDYRNGLAGASSNIGLVLQALARPREAEAHYRQALALLAGLAAAEPATVAHRHDLAGVRTNLAGLLRDTGRPREAEPAYREALDLWSLLASTYPNVPLYRQGLAGTQHGLALLLGALGRVDEARQAFAQALALRGRLVEEFPSVPLYRQELAATEHGLGGLLASAGQPSEAEHAYRRALRHRQGLADTYSGVPAYRQDLAQTLGRLGQVLVAERKPSDAEEAFRAAAAFREGLAVEAPRVPYYQAEWATSLVELADLLRERGAAEEARRLYRRAVGLREQLMAASPATAEYPRDLAWLLAVCPDPEVRDPERSHGLARKAVALAPDDASAWTALGAAAYRLGDAAAAREALAKAAPTGAARFLLAMAQQRLGEHEAARATFQQATAWMEKHRPADGVLRHLRGEAAMVLGVTDEAEERP